MAKTKTGTGAAVLEPPADLLADSEAAWRDYAERVCLEWAAGREPRPEVRDALFGRLGIKGVTVQRQLAEARLFHARRIGTTAQRRALAEKMAEADRAVREEVPQLEAEIVKLQNKINAIRQTQAAAERAKDLSDQSLARLRGFRKDSGCISEADEQAYHGRLACLRSAGAWTELIQKKARLLAVKQILGWNLKDHRRQIAEYAYHHGRGRPPIHGVLGAEHESWWSQEVVKVTAEREELEASLPTLQAQHDREMEAAESVRNRWVIKIDEILAIAGEA